MRPLQSPNCVLMVLIAALACGSDGVSVPCPRPPGPLVPLAETVSVGAVATFAIPANTQNSNRRIEWSATPVTVAAILSGSGSVAARTVGTASILAIDLNSTPTCPDFWEGSLLVR